MVKKTLFLLSQNNSTHLLAQSEIAANANAIGASHGNNTAAIVLGNGHDEDGVDERFSFMPTTTST